METIVKYDNRKLYSRSLKKYVNLSYLIDLAKIGNKFEVKKYKKGVDTDNMDDITAQVLAESIVVLNPSVDLLLRLIRG